MKLIICGDMSVADGSLAHFENADDKKAFCDVADLFKSADRVIVNLECALTEHDKGIRKYGPCLKAPISTAKTLKKAGVTDCTLSNNHIFDFGIKGLDDTVKALDDCSILWTGIGDNYEDSRKNHTITIDGVTVCIINVCEHEYTYATDNRMGARPFDEFETMYDIREAKKSADYVIVIYHGGKEFCKYPSPRLRKACRAMAYSGADCVLCQHSHCIGCYEKYEGAHILYGQGNFHFAWDGWTSDWYEGLIVSLDVDKSGMNIRFIPSVIENGGVRLADDVQAKKILKEFDQRNEELENGMWRSHWHDFCMKNYKSYKGRICGHSLEDDEDKTQLFAHSLDCEAHTDVWREIFPTWNMTNEME